MPYILKLFLFTWGSPPVIEAGKVKDIDEWTHTGSTIPETLLKRIIRKWLVIDLEWNSESPNNFLFSQIFQIIH